jgi:hypothetical protein
MKIKLKAFGILRGLMDIREFQPKIFLAFFPPMEVIKIPNSSPQKAVFEYRGKKEKNVLVYEFVGLEK